MSATITGPGLVELLFDLCDKILDQARAHHQAGCDLLPDDREAFYLELGASNGLNEAHAIVLDAVKAVKR